MNNGKHTYYSGTAGLTLPVANKLQYPSEFKDKSRLTYYSSLFNSIEINSSFYKVPMAKTVARWATEVPDSFQFTFKLWQEITHNKGFTYDAHAIAHFIETINQIGNKKGCLLIQLPPGLKLSLVQLEKILSIIDKYNTDTPWKIAVEFRNNSWYEQETYNLLNEYGAAMVIQDMPASATPILDTKLNFAYLRYHGTKERYGGSYPDDYLQEQADYIKELQAGGKTVYAYFNNTAGGDAVKNLITLNDYMK